MSRPAGFWRRLAAALLDYMAINVIGFVVGFWFGAAYTSITGSRPEADVWGVVIGVVCALGYFTAMEGSRAQATLGKLVLGVMVTTMDGGRLPLPQAAGRQLAKLLSALTLGGGFLMAGFTRRKRALHDLMAESQVVFR